MGYLRYVAGMLAGAVLFSAAGCGGSQINAESRNGGQPPYTAPMPQQRNTGLPQLSTKQKVLLLAGAAAVYYMYKKHQNAQGEGPNGRYYRSKNGRVYYRDMRTGKFQWVDPPSQPIQVPADEYERTTGAQAPSYGGGVIRQAPPGWSSAY